MQEEVKRANIRQLKAIYFSFADTFEVLLHAGRCNFPHKDWVDLVFESDQANVGSIALIAGARVGKFNELDSHAVITNSTKQISHISFYISQSLADSSSDAAKSAKGPRLP